MQVKSNGKPSGPRASSVVPEVLVIGAGFGGLLAAQKLASMPVHVTVLDRANFHLFQPLLYQVAMSGLSPAEIATPIRLILSRSENTRVFLGEVSDIDLNERRVSLLDGAELTYDYLIIAAGARTNYFGHDDWAEHAMGMKDLDDALAIRRRVLCAFEEAERSNDEALRRALCTFVVIGGGPTGVELAGALAELTRHVLTRDFRVVRPSEVRVVLVEGMDRVLMPFDPSLSEHALNDLRKMGVDVRLQTRVTDVTPGAVHLDGETIKTSCAIWAAGVRPVALASRLAESAGVKLDRQGRIIVENDCSIAGHPQVFAVGDIAAFTGADGKFLPGLAPVAMQQGRYVAEAIQRDLHHREREPFSYFDKGIMATIGRSKAVLQSGKIKLTGLIAWLGWVFVHIAYLIGFKNRIAVLFEWFWSYLRYGTGARLITQPETVRLPKEELRAIRALKAPPKPKELPAPPSAT